MVIVYGNWKRFSAKKALETFHLINKSGKKTREYEGDEYEAGIGFEFFSLNQHGIKQEPMKKHGAEREGEVTKNQTSSPPLVNRKLRIIS